LPWRRFRLDGWPKSAPEQINMTLRNIALLFGAIGIFLWCVGWATSLYGDPTSALGWYAVSLAFSCACALTSMVAAILLWRRK